MTNIIEFAAGNPGAMNAIFSVIAKDVKLSTSAKIIEKLEECKTIRGTNLYVLWNDLCGKDIDKMLLVCERVNNTILEDACSRQDYSGRELISKFLN